jgi:hypothetical protein
VVQGRSLAAVASEATHYREHGTLGYLVSSEHTERNMHRALKKQLGILPYEVSLTLKNKKTGTMMLTKVNMVLPHEMFARVYSSGMCNFQKCIIGFEPNGLQHFWDRMGEAVPHFWDNNCGLQSSLQNMCVPISFHSDGVVIFKYGEMTIWSWSCPIVRGEALHTKHVVCVVPTSLLAPNTEAEIVQILAWSLMSLKHGVFPSENHLGSDWDSVGDNFRHNLSGKQLAANYRGIFMFWKGDHKERKRVHQLQRSWQSNYICERDMAAKHVTELSFGDTTATAGWRLTSFGPHLDTVTLSPWKLIPTFSHERVLDDLMHILYLGIGRDLTASIIVDLCQRGEIVSPEALWYNLREWSSQNKLFFNSPIFTMTSLGRKSGKSFPSMDSQVKASNMKVLIKYLAVLTSQRVENVAGLPDFDTGHAKLRGACMFFCAFMIDIWNQHGWIIPPEMNQQAVQAGYDFLASYQQLAVNSLAAGTNLFKFRPKTHYLIHLLDFTAKYRFNPHWMNCMCDEDLMGKIKKN